MFRSCVLILCCFPFLKGQPVPEPGAPEAVTVAQAVQEALDKNLDLLAQKYNLPIATARIIQARLRPNPVLTAGADYQDLLGTGFNLKNQAGPAEGNVRTDFTIEGPGKRRRRIEVAEDGRSIAELQLLDATRLLVLDVQSAFVDVQLAKENLALARENLKALGGIVAINSDRVRAGDLAQVELVRSRVAELQFRNSVLQAELRLRSARNRLQLLLGRPVPSESFDVTGPLRQDSNVSALEELRRQALDLRPDLKALHRDLTRATADIQLQLALAKPDYTVGVQYHRQYVNAAGNSLGLFASMPLPLFNRNQGEVERARQERSQIEARIRALQASITHDVANVYRQSVTSKSLLQSIEKDMLGQALEVRETTEYSYRRGEASFVEFLDAQRAFNDTRQSYNEARAEYARSLYLMDSVSGKVVNP